jgi:hypothetical protein
MRRFCGGPCRAVRQTATLHGGATTTEEEAEPDPAGAQPPGIRGLRFAATVGAHVLFCSLASESFHFCICVRVLHKLN